jgi:hypothetical protein
MACAAVGRAGITRTRAAPWPQRGRQLTRTHDARYEQRNDGTVKKAKSTNQSQTQSPEMADIAPAMTVEWQAIPADGGSVHVFHTEAGVRRWLHTQWVLFVSSWAHDRTCRLNIEVRRVEREVQRFPK